MVGKAARRRRQAALSSGRGPGKARESRAIDPKTLAESALARLIKLNPPGNLSLAGAYALGYCGLAMAQIEGDGPDWFHDLDPLETLFLGTAWPQEFRDSYEFSNACAAWLQLLHGTVHWSGIERFVRETLAASEEHDLPVDEGILMLLLVGRLEAAGLDQRKLACRLLPGELLEGSRCVSGPDPDIRLPDPPVDADERIARFWPTIEVGMPHDGTAVDVLREGLHMLGGAGLDIRNEPILLLPALYAALVADDDEDLTEVGERAMAWALGLNADSPLVPVTDVLIVGPERELTVDGILGRLFGITAFAGQVSREDRVWHSSPGSALIRLAFELGYRHVVTRDAKAVRMGNASAEALRAQFRKFEEKFGRPPGPDDPVFFDPDADEPRPMTLDGVRDATVGLLQAAGVCPAWMYAHERTNGLLPLFDGSFATERDRSDWEAAIQEYIESHDPGARIDHEAEVRKLQHILVMNTMQMAASDPQYAVGLVARMDDATVADDDTMLMGEYLDAWHDWLVDRLRADHEVSEKACEYARAWEGAELAAQVRAVTDAKEQASDAVLLAAAVASFPLRGD
jgi:hypothetical protein